jgi:hypothetical protein
MGHSYTKRDLFQLGLVGGWMVGLVGLNNVEKNSID